MQIDGAHRREEYGAIESLVVEKDAHIGVLDLEHLSLDNLTGSRFPMIRIDGTVDTLYMRDVEAPDTELLKVNGTVKRFDGLR